MHDNCTLNQTSNTDTTLAQLVQQAGLVAEFALPLKYGRMGCTPRRCRPQVSSDCHLMTVTGRSFIWERHIEARRTRKRWAISGCSA